MWLAILFYKTNSYYQSFLKPETQIALFYIVLSYTILGFIYYSTTNKNNIQRTKGSQIIILTKTTIIYFLQIIKNFDYKLSHPTPKISKKEKTAFLFLIVKIFFLPLMLNFFIRNLNNLISYIRC